MNFEDQKDNKSEEVVRKSKKLMIIIGVILVMYIRNILPFLLSFAAGAMIIVAARELLPESVKENKNLSTLGLITGFILMMILDVALG